MKKSINIAIVALTLSISMTACQKQAVETVSLTATESPAISAEALQTEAPVHTATPTITPAETATATPTETPSPTPTPTVEPTQTPTVEPTKERTPTPKPTIKPTATPKSTATPKPTEKATPTPQPKVEPTPTPESTEQPKATVNPVIETTPPKIVDNTTDHTVENANTSVDVKVDPKDWKQGMPVPEGWIPDSGGLDILYDKNGNAARAMTEAEADEIFKRIMEAERLQRENIKKGIGIHGELKPTTPGTKDGQQSPGGDWTWNESIKEWMAN